MKHSISPANNAMNENESDMFHKCYKVEMICLTNIPMNGHEISLQQDLTILCLQHL